MKTKFESFVGFYLASDSMVGDDRTQPGVGHHQVNVIELLDN
jgi:hypothetical protein